MSSQVLLTSTSGRGKNKTSSQPSHDHGTRDSNVWHAGVGCKRLLAQGSLSPHHPPLDPVAAHRLVPLHGSRSWECSLCLDQQFLNGQQQRTFILRCVGVLRTHTVSICLSISSDIYPSISARSWLKNIHINIIDERQWQHYSFVRALQKLRNPTMWD